MSFYFIITVMVLIFEVSEISFTKVYVKNTIIMINIALGKVFYKLQKQVLI